MTYRKDRISKAVKWLVSMRVSKGYCVWGNKGDGKRIRVHCGGQLVELIHLEPREGVADRVAAILLINGIHLTLLPWPLWRGTPVALPVSKLE